MEAINLNEHLCRLYIHLLRVVDCWIIKGQNYDTLGLLYTYIFPFVYYC